MKKWIDRRRGARSLVTAYEFRFLITNKAKSPPPPPPDAESLASQVIQHPSRALAWADGSRNHSHRSGGATGALSIDASLPAIARFGVWDNMAFFLLQEQSLIGEHSQLLRNGIRRAVHLRSSLLPHRLCRDYDSILYITLSLVESLAWVDQEFLFPFHLLVVRLDCAEFLDSMERHVVYMSARRPPTCLYSRMHPPPLRCCR